MFYLALLASMLTFFIYILTAATRRRLEFIRSTRHRSFTRSSRSEYSDAADTGQNSIKFKKAGSAIDLVEILFWDSALLDDIYGLSKLNDRELDRIYIRYVYLKKAVRTMCVVCSIAWLAHLWLYEK
jgi:hypothetical protein